MVKTAVNYSKLCRTLLCLGACLKNKALSIAFMLIQVYDKQHGHQQRLQQGADYLQPKCTY
jgi:hypothetical protein